VGGRCTCLCVCVCILSIQCPALLEKNKEKDVYVYFDVFWHVPLNCEARCTALARFSTRDAAHCQCTAASTVRCSATWQLRTGEARCASAGRAGCTSKYRRLFPLAVDRRTRRSHTDASEASCSRMARSAICELRQKVGSKG